ncbi:MAG: HNH endonuclease [Microcystis aeruginosa WS75]|nr:HNH endonuclease [Microcystis aeruginosa WS75]
MVDSLPLRNLKYYCERFASLNVSKKRGNAQYKPILLLSVIDLISQGLITENKIFVSDELINTFNKYWNVLSSQYDGGFHYPFFHLQSERFWYLRLKPDFNGLQPKSMKKLKLAVEYAFLDEELYDLLQYQNYRQELIDTLISVWFSSSQKEISEILTINNNLQDVTREELSLFDNVEQEKKFYLRKSLIRSAFFRKAVVYIYNYQCSFCGLKVIHSLTQSIVDGAHIKPFAKFYDNQINNGLSLCKNHHWAFDQGLFTIDDQYKIIITKDFEEVSPNAKAIKDFHGMNILLPTLEDHYPKLEAIQWHRQNIFRN